VTIEDILNDRFPRKEGKLLKYNSPVNAWRDNLFPIGKDLPSRRGNESSDDIKERALAAATGSNEGEKLALAHL
jgi:hypothetical protein